MTSAPPKATAPPYPYHLRTDCRGCGGQALRRFLELGPQPLANAFPKSPAEFAVEARYPLDLYFCEGCSLVQVLDVIDPSVLFRHYLYVTGTSSTIAAHNAAYAETLRELLGLRPSDLVVEAASNDGSLLRCFTSYGVRTLGIEPARNIAALARAQGIETDERFFGEETARAVVESHGRARAVIGNNVLAHVDDTRDFLRGAATLVADDGLVVVEVPYLRDFVERLEYDTVYHEHLCYFSVTAIMRLCDQVGLTLVRVDHVPVHGGSIRFYAGLRVRHRDHSPAVEALAAEERVLGLTSLDRYLRFANDVRTNREEVRTLLGRLRADGRTIAGYGAPAKGNTLLNFCDIGPDLVPYTVDRNELKVGRYTPGTHIPVLPVETILERQPDYLFILAWNFAGEIMAQQAEYRNRGGRFILPIPAPVVH